VLGQLEADFIGRCTNAVAKVVIAYEAHVGHRHRPHPSAQDAQATCKTVRSWVGSATAQRSRAR